LSSHASIVSAKGKSLFSQSLLLLPINYDAFYTLLYEHVVVVHRVCVVCVSAKKKAQQSRRRRRLRLELAFFFFFFFFFFFSRVVVVLFYACILPKLFY